MDKSKYLLPWKEKIMLDGNPMYLRYRLSGDWCEVGIYQRKQGKRAGYEYLDWWNTQRLYWGQDLERVKKEVDRKLVKAGYRLLTDEEASRLKVLL